MSYINLWPSLTERSCNHDCKTQFACIKPSLGQVFERWCLRTKTFFTLLIQQHIWLESSEVTIL